MEHLIICVIELLCLLHRIETMRTFSVWQNPFFSPNRKNTPTVNIGSHGIFLGGRLRKIDPLEKRGSTVNQMCIHCLYITLMYFRMKMVLKGHSEMLSQERNIPMLTLWWWSMVLTMREEQSPLVAEDTILRFARCYF